MTALPCSSHGCALPARTAVEFHGMVGHVHDCDAHTHALREHADVARTADLNPDGTCPWAMICAPDGELLTDGVYRTPPPLDTGGGR